MAADPTPSPSFDTAPRLQSSSADPASGYAPIAWSAVAALAIGIFFVCLFLYLRWTTFSKNEPLVAPWLFVLPVIGIIVAFIARRQIAASEGTRIGVPYANAGWWLCLVGGLVYAAYLGALEYTIRADAASQFRTWSAELSKIVPDAVDQPELFNAFYRTLPPQQRIEFNPQSYAADPNGPSARVAREKMRSLYAPLLLKFRQSQVVMQAARYGDECQFEAEGLRDWRYQDQGKKIECALTSRMRTPEGDFPLVVPMEAFISGGNREWQVKPLEGSAGGAPRLTPYGFLLAGWVPRSAHDAAGVFLATRLWSAVRPKLVGPEFAAVVGPLVSISAASPELPNAGFAINPVITLPDMSAPPYGAVSEFKSLWESPNSRDRFRVTDILGEGLGEDPAMPIIDVTPERLLVKAPFQYQPYKAQKRGAGIRMRLVMECTDPAVLSLLGSARASAGTDPRTADLPKDSPIAKLSLIPFSQWKLLRIESDFLLVEPPQQASPGGPPGSGR